MTRQCVLAGYLPNAYNDSFEAGYKKNYLEQMKTAKVFQMKLTLMSLTLS